MSDFEECNDWYSEYRAACGDLARVTAERDAAVTENKWINGERTTLLCLCNEMSPDDAPDVVTREMAYDAVDKMQDRLFAAEGERDALRAEVEAMRGVVEAARVFVEADGSVSEDAMRAALDALRTRKVGG